MCGYVNCIRKQNNQNQWIDIWLDANIQLMIIETFEYKDKN